MSVERKLAILNNVINSLTNKTGQVASNIGSSMIDYSTGGDYLGLGYDEKISSPTGLNRTPSPLELNLKMAQENPTVTGVPLPSIQDKVNDWGKKLYQWGQSKNERNQYLNNFYKNNLSLSDQGKKDFSNTNIVHNTDVLDYAKNIPNGVNMGSQGVNWGGQSEKDIRKNINISPSSLGKQKREILLHELTHYVDSKHALSTQKDFLKDLNSTIKNNPIFGNYINNRIKDYGGLDKVQPTEIYSFVTEYLSKIKSGQTGGMPIGFPKKLVKYFPHIEVPKGLLTN